MHNFPYSTKGCCSSKLRTKVHGMDVTVGQLISYSVNNAPLPFPDDPDLEPAVT